MFLLSKATGKRNSVHLGTRLWRVVSFSGNEHFKLDNIKKQNDLEIKLFLMLSVMDHEKQQNIYKVFFCEKYTDVLGKFQQFILL